MTLEARVRECAALLEQDRGALAGRAAAALAEEAGLRAEECWGAARPRDDEAALLSVFVQRFAAVQGCESADCKALEAAFEAARLRRGAEEAAAQASRAKLPPETREAAAAALREHPTLRTAFSEYCEVLRLLQTLGDNGGWESIANANGVQTLFRAEADAATLSIKTLGVIDSPIFNVVALINEIDLLGTFIPRVYARMLRQISRFRQLVHVLLALPWPFASRDVVLEGRGVDMLEHNAVVVTARNVEVPQEELPPECRSDAVRVVVHHCGALILPIGRDKCFMAVMANVDPKLSYVPTGLINFLNKQLAYYGFVLFRAKARNLADSEHERRIREKRDVYGEVERRLGLPAPAVQAAAAPAAASAPASL